MIHNKHLIPLYLDVMVEEQLHAQLPWQAQFKVYPYGYFRGQGLTPAAALAVAWREFRAEVDPGRRWWSAVTQGRIPVPRM